MNQHPTVRLGDILDPSSKSVQVEDEVEYRQVTVRTKGMGLVQRAVLPGHKIRTKRQFRVSARQWLVSKIDARNGAMGLVPAVLHDAIVTQDFPAFDVDHRACIPEYFEALTSRPEFWDECLHASEGSTNRVRLRIDRLLDIEIELPPVAEQAATVGVAQAVAEVEAAARVERRMADQLLMASVDQELATEPADRGSSWRRVELGDLADVRSGITKGRTTKSALRPVSFLRAANVQNGVLDLGEIKTIEATETEVGRFRLEPGDVLMVEGSGSPDRLGRGWMWEGQLPQCLHQNHVFRARPNTSEIVPRFLAYALTSTSAREYFVDAGKSTSGLYTINRAQVVACPLVLPPLGVQSAIVGRLDAIRDLVTVADEAIERIMGLRKALVGSLLSGEIRPPQALGLGEGGASPG